MNMRMVHQVLIWLKLLCGLGCLLALYMYGRGLRRRMSEDLRAIANAELEASEDCVLCARPVTKGAIYLGQDPDPELMALLEKAKYYRMPNEEIEAQRQSWARQDMD